MIKNKLFELQCRKIIIANLYKTVSKKIENKWYTSDDLVKTQKELELELGAWLKENPKMSETKRRGTIQETKSEDIHENEKDFKDNQISISQNNIDWRKLRS